MNSTQNKGSTMGLSSASNNLKKQERSSEEEIMSKEIQSVEIARLAKVFDQLRLSSEATSDQLNNSNHNIS